MNKHALVFVLLLAIIGAILIWYGSSHTHRQTTALKETHIAQSGTKTPQGPPNNACPYTFVSWNLANFGRSKTDEDISVMARVLSSADIVAIQEVTAGKDFGVQAVAKLALALGRTGAAWDYIVSDPTLPPSAGVERYAFLWKQHTLSIDRDAAHLVSELQDAIDREPFTLLFRLKKAPAVSIFTIHTVPTAKGPIDEVEALSSAKELANASRAILAGDFNLGAKKTDPLMARIGFIGHIVEQTSLKKTVRSGGYTLYQYDNIYTKGVAVCTSGVIDFVEAHFSPVTDDSLSRARRVSDHLPVFATFR